MACEIVHIEEILTPTRKRKRNLDELRVVNGGNGLANEGFSSTPKKEAKVLIESLYQFAGNTNHRGLNPFMNGCLEVKSIADIANERTEVENPFEIVRKPPKKKKKADIKEACFENPALNLEGPETQFNPFEVKRTLVATGDENCFINPALNMKSPENAAVNPYEIARCKNTLAAVKEGIENPVLEEPSALTIGLPFTPTIGCRIDFNNISLNSLTPSKLLAEKLVFSPTAVKGTTPYKQFRRSLSVISEETVDISKELDCYQLELENSINEAKMKKNNGDSEIVQLKNIYNSVEGKFKETELSFPCSPEVIIPPTIIEESAEDSFTDDIDFKAPAPFVRCYRKDEKLPSKPQTGNDSTDKSTNNDKSHPEHGSKHKVSNLIRKSFRKLIHSYSEKDKTEKLTGEKPGETATTNFVNTIRHSLRRRNKSEPKTIDGELIAADNSREISILDPVDQRAVFKFTAECEEIKSGEKVNTEKSSFRRSLRRSTRDVRNQVLKTVFNKNFDEYKMKR